MENLFFSKENMITIYNIFSDFLINKKNINKNIMDTPQIKEFIYKNMIDYKNNNEIDNIDLKKTNIEFINRIIDTYLTEYIIIDSSSRDIEKFPNQIKYDYGTYLFEEKFSIEKVILKGIHTHTILTINNINIPLIVENVINNEYTIMKPLIYKQIDVLKKVSIFFDDKMNSMENIIFLKKEISF
jgi:hypothetical protein